MKMRPEAKSETLTIRISREVKERLVARAIREKRTFALESEFLIEKALNMLEESGQAKETAKAMADLRRTR